MINPKSLDNLKPFDTMDRERHREISRRGGIASGASRRELRALREKLEAVLRFEGAISDFMQEIPKKRKAHRQSKGVHALRNKNRE
jgi:hypothetical protein